jgi:predicted outer membrane protein
MPKRPRSHAIALLALGILPGCSGGDGDTRREFGAVPESGDPAALGPGDLAPAVTPADRQYRGVAVAAGGLRPGAPGAELRDYLRSVGKTRLLQEAPDPTKASRELPQPSLDDSEALHVAVTILYAGVAAATLAIERAQDSTVRGFAEAVLEGHGSVMADSTELGQLFGFTNNYLSGQLQAQSTAALERLAATPAADFDQSYLDGQIQVDERELALLTNVLIPESEHPRVRAFLELLAAATSAELESARAVKGALDSR